MSRVITVVLEIKDTAEASQLWDAHLRGNTALGCLVKSISNGDIPNQLDKLQERLSEEADL